jgi:hypothetical protein
MSELTFDNKFESFRTFRGAQMRTDMTMGLVNKRKFRCYREFTGATVLRFTAARDFLLTAQDLQRRCWPRCRSPIARRCASAGRWYVLHGDHRDWDYQRCVQLRVRGAGYRCWRGCLG